MDAWLARTRPGRSRREWKALLLAGKVHADGRRLRPGDDPARIGGAVEVRGDPGDPAAPGEAGVESIPGDFVLSRQAFLALLPVPPVPPVLWQDSRYAVLDKPARMPSHPLGFDDPLWCLSDLAARIFPGSLRAGADPREGGLLHRLDTDTSGCVLVALDVQAWQAALPLMRQGGEGVEKTYLALVLGGCPRDGVTDFPVAHSARRDGRMVALGGAMAGREYRGLPRPASSCIRVEWTRPTRDGRWFSLIEVALNHGQRHQVRVHCAALGHPLWGDVLYGGAQKLHLDGLSVQVRTTHALHAARLRFLHPLEGGMVEVGAPLPDGFMPEPAGETGESFPRRGDLHGT